ncbi:MAG: threonine--tRNA ligase [Alphaproteobacteria bacterium]|nr:threonine--tRNA ligase [Alphaproteobacteria bacterium]
MEHRIVSAPVNEIRITLPDGSVRTTARGATGADVAASIGAGLAKAALAVKVNGEMKDLDWPIQADAKVEIITRKSEEALDLIRHDTAHLLAQAVQALYPGTQVTIGPNIEDGFYYDFARNEPFRPEDLPLIEAKMKELVAADLPTKRTAWDRDKAVQHFLSIGEQYKAELIRDFPAGEEVRVYYHGDWHDLCRGPHLMSTGKIGTAFKLTKIAGAYWRGDAKNAQLQRIYGTAWRDEKELAAYLTRIEEAEKRDHRKIGKEMDLFHIQEEAVGQIFWHPKGWTLYRTLENYVRRQVERADYREVKTPQLMDRKLWEASGHWENYRAHMFIAEVDEGDDKDKRMLAVKPMNCPGHVQIFKQGLKSYRDLPLRMAEFGSCHRYEPSGALHGIMRVRAFVQDDAHIFCTEDQIIPETHRFVDLLSRVYKDLGFDAFTTKLSTRPQQRAGTDEQWDRAEAALELACRKIDLPYSLNPGEGAFYGPKLEFTLRDAIGRDWQCGTLQVDYVLPERLDAEYIAEDGNRKRPVMLHRAILGSLERFIGVTIEHYAGKFPLWMAPVQAVVATIVSDADAYAKEAVAALKLGGIRVETDLRNEKINYKVREHSLAKVPYLLVVGRKEAEERTVSIRRLGSEKQETMALDAVIKLLQTESTPPDMV